MPSLSFKVILWFFAALSLNVCVASLESITLDLSKPLDSTYIVLKKKDLSNILTHKYTPTNKSQIVRVIDDRSLIWDGTSGDTKCSEVIAHLFDNSSLYLHIKLNDRDLVSDLYFKKEDDVWHAVESSKLPYQYHFDQESYSIHKSSVFDLSSKTNTDLYTVHKSKRNGIVYGTYSPKLGVKVDRVVCGNQVVWGKSSESNLFQITVCYSGNTPIFAELVLDNSQDPETLHFERKGDKWTPISNKSYKLKLDSHDFTLPLFDIKSLDSSRFKMEKYEISGIDTYVYTPVLGTWVHNIGEGNMPIWESKVGDYVDKIWLYSKNGKYVTTNLRIVNSNNGRSINNYKRHKEGWKLTLKDDL
ncbi:uncharacterized protein TOT_020000679 [Theileria orientalis strain Shintoku]|uniref:SfiI-subtelomeric related protein family member n=1 Tax=Theileria orientalis strain Shintoku TaxID=869250 RepID=J4C8A0_THEOR|nr:uncharacterized protein TOT_020000679 [Theileria orientalis strain Shintoku]PVC52163.1 hypothetical protein MACL_00000978 [Theileria orientalis]BAM40423.1 uncharacterized protein TOT_020000679 [Theileria orientalis strain Shintoku]|eukprot:XP_009690724.1 uncharacterized protein TOT_020000679 [Theileria orientalis strain Shintoku]